MPNLGMGELVLIFLMLVLVFGADRLPRLGDGIGKAIRNFKRGMNTDDDIEVTAKSEKSISEKSSAEKIDDAEIVERMKAREK